MLTSHEISAEAHNSQGRDTQHDISNAFYNTLCCSCLKLVWWSFAFLSESVRVMMSVLLKIENFEKHLVLSSVLIKIPKFVMDHKAPSQ